MRSVNTGVLLIAAVFTSAFAQPNQNLITLERGTCFGTCPPYLLQIDSSGAVSFRAGPPGSRREVQTSTITADQFQDLVAEFANIHFFEFNDSYRETHTDGPKISIGLTLEGKAKIVAHFDAAPPGLDELERRIDLVANVHRWLHRDARRFALQSPISGRQMGGGEDLKNEAFVREDLYYGSKPGLTELMRAARMGNAADVRRALQTGQDVNAADETGWTALMVAAVTAQPQAVSTILEAGAPVDQRDNHGDTALIGAAAVRFANLRLATEVVGILLAHGASVDAINDLGESALMWAARSGNPDSIKSLLAAGADPARLDQSGHNALFYLRSARDGLTFDPALVERYDRAGSELLNPVLK
jgi:hypothetical protein